MKNTPLFIGLLITFAHQQEIHAANNRPKKSASESSYQIYDSINEGIISIIAANIQGLTQKVPDRFDKKYALYANDAEPLIGDTISQDGITINKSVGYLEITIGDKNYQARLSNIPDGTKLYLVKKITEKPKAENEEESEEKEATDEKTKEQNITYQLETKKEGDSKEQINIQLQPSKQSSKILHIPKFEQPAFNLPKQEKAAGLGLSPEKPQNTQS